jgi:hypothetical protein
MQTNIQDKKKRKRKRYEQNKKNRKINKDDIKYQDDLVCILKPESKKGILIYTHYTQPENTEDLRLSGLKTGRQLHTEGINFNRTIYHPYIFFRAPCIPRREDAAPYYSNDIDYTSVETEINTLYGSLLQTQVIFTDSQRNMSSKIWIRVDPDKTFVFSSEIRTKSEYINNNWIINNSKKTLSNYLEIIKRNSKIEKGDKQIFYNLFSSEAVLFPKCCKPNFPFDDCPIERNSEILVKMPHLTSDYFVL